MWVIMEFAVFFSVWFVEYLFVCTHITAVVVLCCNFAVDLDACLFLRFVCCSCSLFDNRFAGDADGGFQSSWPYGTAGFQQHATGWETWFEQVPLGFALSVCVRVHP